MWICQFTGRTVGSRSRLITILAASAASCSNSPVIRRSIFIVCSVTSGTAATAATAAATSTDVGGFTAATAGTTAAATASKIEI
jgi:hypothetical protein